MGSPAFVSTALPLKGGSSSSALSQLRDARRLCARTPLMSADNSSSSNPAPATESKPKPKPASPFKSGASWSTDFFPGFGRKGPGSDPEWDLRPKNIRTNDVGIDICTACKGTGKMVCTFCEGVTFKGEDGAVMNCPACGGESNLKCSVCYGSGKQPELKDKWWVEGMAAQFED